MNLTHAEYCALKLLKLCASPGKIASYSPFVGFNDADGNNYTTLISGLQKKGFARVNEGLTHVEIL